MNSNHFASWMLAMLLIASTDLSVRGAAGDPYSVSISREEQDAIVSLSKGLGHGNSSRRAASRKQAEAISPNARRVLIAILLTFDDPELMGTARDMAKADEVILPEPDDNGVPHARRTSQVSITEVQFVAQECGLLAERSVLEKTYASKHPRLMAVDQKLESVRKQLLELRKPRQAEQTPAGDVLKAAPEE